MDSAVFADDWSSLCYVLMLNVLVLQSGQLNKFFEKFT